MFITIIRSGGITGINITKHIDTSSLPIAKQQFFLSFLTIHHFFTLKKKGYLNRPDRFQYRIRIEDHGKTHEIIRNEHELGILKQLVDAIL